MNILAHAVWVICYVLTDFQKDNILDDEDLAPLYKYNDNLLIADYAKQPIAVLIKNDLIKGNNNMINPVQNATRAETAVFIYRLYSML